MRTIIKSVERARLNAPTRVRLFVLSLILIVVGIAAAGSLMHSRVQLTQHSEAQATGQGGGLVQCVVSGGILGGKCTISSPLTATITTDATLTGTGSAGSPLSAATALASLDFFMFGDGSDGACAFDGVTTPVAGATLSGSTYTMTHDVFCSSGTIATGVSVTGPYRFFDNGTLTLTGTAKIHRNGNAGGTPTAGAGLAAGSLPASSAGGTGGSTAGVAASGGGVGNPAPRDCTAGAIAASGNNGGTCQGGSGGTGAGGAGAAGGTVTLAATTTGDIRVLNQAVLGRQGNASQYVFSSGGGGGRGDAANAKAGGGGGGTGGYMFVGAKKIVGTGTIESKGGAGGDGGVGGNTGSGAGGAGGRTFVVIGTGSCPSMVVTGGTHGAKQGTGGDGGNGGSGVTHCMKAGY